MQKLIGILIVMLLIGTIVLPLVGSSYKKNIDIIEDFQLNNRSYVLDDCRCKSNSINYLSNGFLTMSDPLVFRSINDEKYDTTIKELPDYFSWNDYNSEDWTTPAKNQGNCGSCWDFAALGALESIIKIQEDLSSLNPDLSEQYVLSCLPKAANTNGKGCSGGNPYNAFKCIMKNDSRGNYCNGIPLEVCMPYQADDTINCEEKTCDWEQYLVPITGRYEWWWLNHDETTLNQIKTTIIENGPVAAGMNVTEDFSVWGNTNHEQSDYFPDTQEEWAMYLNHIIVIVGWKDDPSIGNGGYWICKNSWGDNFGYNGFFNIEYGALFTGWYTAWATYDPENYDWQPTPESNGPYYGLTNEPIELTGNVSGENPPFTWHWDFGDGTTSTEQNPTHTYTSSGDFTITVVVTDNKGNRLNDTTQAWIQDDNQPPLLPTIEGPSEVKVGERCWYNFTFNDPDGSPLFVYMVGYGLESNMWWGPFSNGILKNYWYWEEEGDFVVKVKTKDPYGAESDWAILEVTVPKNKSDVLQQLVLQHFIERFPILKFIFEHIGAD